MRQRSLGNVEPNGLDPLIVLGELIRLVAPVGIDTVVGFRGGRVREATRLDLARQVVQRPPRDPLQARLAPRRVLGERRVPPRRVRRIQ